MHGSTVTYRSVSWRMAGGCSARIWLRATNSAWRVPCGRILSGHGFPQQYLVEAVCGSSNGEFCSKVFRFGVLAEESRLKTAVKGPRSRIESTHIHSDVGTIHATSDDLAIVDEDTAHGCLVGCECQFSLVEAHFLLVFATQ